METTKLYLNKKLADEMLDNLACMYLSALASQQHKDITDLTKDDLTSAMNYARSKFVGITAEFEYDNCEWCIVNEEE